jgi:hypothetical protein
MTSYYGNSRAHLCNMTRVLLFFVLCCISATILSAQEPQRLPQAKPSDCAACHTGKSPLPKDHPATAGLTMSDCQGCHAKGSENSLAGKLPLSHVHQMQGVTCGKCHEDMKSPKAVAKAKCVSCHDVEKLAAATASVKPNPHDSPHYGKEADCNLCHHQHVKSENDCLQCHNFDFKLP